MAAPERRSHPTWQELLKTLVPMIVNLLIRILSMFDRRKET